MTFHKLSLEKFAVSLPHQIENKNPMKAINTNQANQNRAGHTIYMYSNDAMGSFPGIVLEGKKKDSVIIGHNTEDNGNNFVLCSKHLEWHKQYFACHSKHLEWYAKDFKYKRQVCESNSSKIFKTN